MGYYLWNWILKEPSEDGTIQLRNYISYLEPEKLDNQEIRF